MALAEDTVLGEAIAVDSNSSDFLTSTILSTSVS